MKNAWVLILCVIGGFTVPVQAQEKTPRSAGNAALEKELYTVELKWMQAEHDKKTSGPDVCKGQGEVESSWGRFGPSCRTLGRKSGTKGNATARRQKSVGRRKNV